MSPTDADFICGENWVIVCQTFILAQIQTKNIAKNDTDDDISEFLSDNTDFTHQHTFRNVTVSLLK